MTRTLKLVPGPSIPPEPPPSPYLTLSPDAKRTAHAIRASGVRIGNLGDVTTEQALNRAIREAEALMKVLPAWVKMMKEIGR